VLGGLGFSQQRALVTHARNSADDVVERHERKAEPKTASRNGQQFQGQAAVFVGLLAHDFARITDMTMKPT